MHKMWWVVCSMTDLSVATLSAWKLSPASDDCEAPLAGTANHAPEDRGSDAVFFSDNSTFPMHST